MSDYTNMSAGEMHTALSDADGMKWTEAFRQINPECNVSDDIMLGWFCNAIMAGYDKACGNQPLCGDHAAFLLGDGS